MSTRGWWSLGEYSGHDGQELALWRVECGFCGEKGNWELSHHQERANKEKKKLNYDTYKCLACGNLAMVFWSAGDRLHSYHQVPWPQKTTSFPKHWPAEVGRYWMQAQRSLEGGNWDAAAFGGWWSRSYHSFVGRPSLRATLANEKHAIGSNPFHCGHPMCRVRRGRPSPLRGLLMYTWPYVRDHRRFSAFSPGNTRLVAAGNRCARHGVASIPSC